MRTYCRDHLAPYKVPKDFVTVQDFPRTAAGKMLIAREDTTIRAVASDAPLDLAVPVLDLDDTDAIADFIARELGL